MAVNRKLFEQVVDKIDRDEMVKLLQELIGIKSVFFEEKEIIEHLRKRLSASDRLTVEIHRFAEDKITNFEGKNLIVKLSGKGNGPRLLINAHVDTVPLCDGWTVDPYSGIEKDGRIYGLGSLDMKSGVVMAVTLLESLVAAGVELTGDIIFTAVSGEEGPFGLGTFYTMLDGIVDGCDYAIITEAAGPFAGNKEKFPSIALGGRGTAVYFVEVEGLSAHGATPERGINAVEDAARVITALREKLDLGFHPQLGSGSMCITNLRGGDKYLLVPERASFTIYRHTVDGDADKALREVREIVDSLDLKSKVSIKLRDLPHPDAFFEPWLVDEKEKVVEALQRGCVKVMGIEPRITYFRAECDANHLASRAKIPTAIFGPDGDNYHAPDEYVDIDSMVKGTAVLVYSVLELLS